MNRYNRRFPNGFKTATLLKQMSLMRI